MKRLGVLIGLLLWTLPCYAQEMRTADSTSQLIQFFVNDSSVSTGAGLTGLAYTGAGITPTCYYHRSNSATATAITLVDMTVGTFTSSGFKKIDDTHMAGWYQMGLPNAAIASGATDVSIQCYGATNMAPMNKLIQIVGTADVNCAQISGTTGATELSACPAGTATFGDQIQFLFEMARNQFDVTKVTSSSATGVLRKDNGSSALCTFSQTDNGTVMTNGEGS